MNGEVPPGVPVTTHRTTGDLGWPNSKIPVSELHGQFYFPIKDVLEEFDLKGNAENARLKQQIAAFKKMANDIHHGSKEDLIAGIAESASKKPVNSHRDGFLSAQDLLLIAKRVNDPKKKKSLYEILTSEYSAKESHFSAMEISINCSMTQLSVT